MSIPHTCPVYYGKGLVLAGFYDQPNLNETITTFEQCRSCTGTGVVWNSSVSVERTFTPLPVVENVAMCTCSTETRNEEPYVNDVTCPVHAPKVITDKDFSGEY